MASSYHIRQSSSKQAVLVFLLWIWYPNCKLLITNVHTLETKPYRLAGCPSHFWGIGMHIFLSSQILAHHPVLGLSAAPIPELLGVLLGFFANLCPLQVRRESQQGKDLNIYPSQLGQAVAGWVPWEVDSDGVQFLRTHARGRAEEESGSGRSRSQAGM